MSGILRALQVAHLQIWLETRMSKRDSFSAEKLGIVEHPKATGDTAATVSLHYPKLKGSDAAARRKLVLGWRRDEEKLRAVCQTMKGGARKKARPLGITSTLSPDVEEEIVVWINDLRGEGVPISSLMLQLQAKVITASNNVAVGFEASWWWQKRFVARRRLSMRARTRQGQITPSELDAIATSFAQTVKEKNDAAQRLQCLQCRPNQFVILRLYILYPLHVRITPNGM